MARKRKNGIDVPNLYSRFDKRTDKTYYQYKNPVTGRFIGLGCDFESACKSARDANLIIEKRGLKQILAEQQRANALLVEEQGILCGEFCEKYRAYIKRMFESGKWSEATYKMKICMVNLFEDRFSTTRIKMVKTKDIASVLDEYVSRDKNTMAASIRHNWSQLYKEAGYMGEVEGGFNPVLSTRPIVVNVQRSRLTEDDFLRLFEVIEDHKPTYLKKAVKLAVTTGLRRADLTSLRFADVKDGYLHVSVEKSRGKVRLAFPLSMKNPLIGQTLGEIIEECQQKVRSPFILHHVDYRKRIEIGGSIHPNLLTNHFKKVWDKSGLQVVNGHTPPSFHELRSLCARSYGAKFEQMQALLGHRDKKMTERYLDERSGSQTLFIEIPEVA